MRRNLSLFLWQKRMSARLRRVSDALRLIVDFWIALYIIIPLSVLVFCTYRECLIALPYWFMPEYELLLLVLLAWVTIKGNLRTYLVQADLAHLFYHPKKFNLLLCLGVISSFILNSIRVVVVVFAFYPIYLHLAGVSWNLWFYIGLWALLLRMLVLGTKFFIQQRFPKYIKWFFDPLFLIAYIAAWQMLVRPYIYTAQGLYLIIMIKILLLMLVLVVVLKYLFPVKDWEEVVNSEAFYDSTLMGSLLGYAGQPARKRNGYSFWSPRRLGIPFKTAYTHIYFYVKYLMRNGSWQILYLQFFVMGALVVLFPLPDGVRLGFLIAIILMLGFLLRRIIYENEEKLKAFLGTFPAGSYKKGKLMLYNSILPTISILPLLAGLAGNTGWIEVVGGIVLLAIFAYALSRFLVHITGYW